MESATAARVNQHTINHTTESKEEGEAKIDLELQAHPRMSPLAAQILIQAKARFNEFTQATTATLSTLSTSSSSATSTPDYMICHCLVVDESKLDESDAQEYAKALSLGANPNDVLAQVKLWLLDYTNTIASAHVPANERKKLHITFSTQNDLGLALKQYPFLFRCGVVGSSAWGSQPCGPLRHMLPEMIHFEFTPTREYPKAELTKAVEALLAEMKLEYYALWF